MIGQAASRRLLLAASLSVLFVAVDSARADLAISGYQDRLHDLYYVGADKAFIGSAYNWSGVGRIPDPSATGINWKSVVMISDNYFITANHNQPNRGNDPSGPAPKVRFYRTANPQGEYWETEIAATGTKYQGERIGLSDLWVGKLANTPPSWVMRYPLAKRHEATNYLSYTDKDMFIFGQDSPRGWTSVRVGRNEIDQVDSGGNYQWDFDATGGLGADEAETQLGDSGSPSFFTFGATPIVAGMHTRENFDTGVSKNLQQIIDAVGESISLATNLEGDLNGDFRVNYLDLSILAANLNTSTIPSYGRGDLTGNGKVDNLDLIRLARNLGGEMFAPTDFNRDGDVDGGDLATIANHWQKSVSTPFTMGDANGDAFVNLADVSIFDDNQYRAFFGPLPAPLSPISGDLTGNGVVDGFDLGMVTANLNRVVTPGTNGDADGNGVVNNLDVAFVSTKIGNSFGDLNGDHAVDPLDLTILANNFNKKVTGGRLAGDLNGNGWVSNTDAYVLFQWWGQQGGEFPGMLVPEPASLVLAICVWSAAFSRTRRRRPTTSRGPC